MTVPVFPGQLTHQRYDMDNMYTSKLGEKIENELFRLHWSVGEKLPFSNVVIYISYSV
jgi:hypothetical protein